MKNIIDLYEASLLGDIEDTLNDGDKYIEWTKTFGANYALSGMVDTTQRDYACFNTKRLMELTEGMHVNECLKRYRENKFISDQLYYLGVFIDNLTTKELKITGKKLHTMPSHTKPLLAFGDRLKEILTDAKIFISEKKIINISRNAVRERLIITIQGDIKEEWVQFNYVYKPTIK